MARMTTQQALGIVERVTGEFRGTRQDHLSIIDAIQTLRDATTSPKEPEKHKEEKPNEPAQ